MPEPFYLASVTRLPQSEFDRGSLLGRSLNAMPPNQRPKLYLRVDNRGPQAMGLSEAYNQILDQLPNKGIVLFVHDDLYIHDWFVGQRLEEALLACDLVGLAGASGVTADQPGWLHQIDHKGTIQRQTQGLSGIINLYDPTTPIPVTFGQAPMQCELLDGVFLAAKLEVLKKNDVRFDPQFRFHGYDSDFCRSALAAGLRVGTWPISCTHGNIGNLDADWYLAADRYRQKWAKKPLKGHRNGIG